jgi:hypothetical protein
MYSSCVKEAVLKSGNAEREPVLVARFTGNANDPSAVRLTWSTTPEVEEIAVPEDARIFYYSGSEKIGEAQPDAEGYCAMPSYFPRPGETFKVEAHIPGYMPIIGTDEMPQGAAVIESSFQSAGLRDEDDTFVYSAKVKFQDTPGIENYYEIIFFEATRSQAKYFRIPFEVDVILKNEGDQDFEPLSFFFSDELFDGQVVEIEILLRGYVTRGEELDHRPFYLLEDGRYMLFRTISRNWYEYLKAYTRHRYTRLVGQGLSGGATFQDFQDLLFAPEPTPMFSNVENGLGVVAGAHTQIIKMDD